MDKIIITIDADMIELATQFTTRKKDEVKQLLANFDSTPISDLKSFGHKLKGTAGSYNIDQVGNLGREIENSDDKIKIKSLLTDILSLLSQINFSS